MPSERRGTVTDDIAGYIRRLQGTSEWRGDKAGTIRAAIAKVSYLLSVLYIAYSMIPDYWKLYFPIEDVVKNVRQFVTVVKRATGNQKDPEDQKKGKSTKPGESYSSWALMSILLTTTFQLLR